MSRYLVTGAAGFVGSHIVEELLQRNHDVTALDCLTYAGGLGNLAHLITKRLSIVHHDFTHPLPNIGNFDCIIHCGAQSHVKRSLEDPGTFVRSNTLGTLNLLEYARRGNLKKFVYVSTDEVFGPARATPYRESDTLNPTNPYSAAKAGGEFLVHSYYRSFGVPVVTTRTCNIFGERQHHEKFVPLVIGKVLRGEVVDIHANPLGGSSDSYEVGSRNWLYAGAQARALAVLAEHGIPGQVCHISAGVRKSNLEIAQLIAKILRLPLKHRIVNCSRSHDIHYALKESPQAVFWKSTTPFEEFMKQTVLWYKGHQEFLA
jgi:dTDP-glucose 4,6-dehydratase